MNRDELVSLRDALGEIGRVLGVPVGAFDAIVAAWPAVAGPDVAPHARVRSLRAGECVVEVDGPAWATRVRYLGPELRRRVNEACQSEVMTRMTVVVKAARTTR